MLLFRIVLLVLSCLALKSLCLNCKIGILDILDYTNEDSPTNQMLVANSNQTRLTTCLQNFNKQPNITRYKFYEHADVSFIMIPKLAPHLEAFSLINHLRKKDLVVPVDEADLVLMNDFCFMQQFAPHYAIGKQNITAITKILDYIRDTDRWKRKNGSDFVFVRGYPRDRILYQRKYVYEYLRQSYFVLYEWGIYFKECDLAKRPMGYKTVLMPYYVPTVGINQPKTC